MAQYSLHIYMNASVPSSPFIFLSLSLSTSPSSSLLRYFSPHILPLYLPLSLLRYFSPHILPLYLPLSASLFLSLNPISLSPSLYFYLSFTRPVSLSLPRRWRCLGKYPGPIWWSCEEQECLSVLIFNDIYCCCRYCTYRHRSRSTGQ